jgi:parallel beta-helix repeat protein
MQTLVVLLVMLATASLTALAATPAHGFDLLVDDNLVPCVAPAPPVFQTIQDAVDVATAGQSIGVCPGTYAETVTVDVAGLSIEGIGVVKVTTPGGAGPERGFHVTVPDVTLRRLEILGFANPGSCGVLVDGASGATVVSNRVHDNDAGVCVDFSDGTRVHHNIVRDNAAQGILALNVNAIEINSNTITGNARAGIFAMSVDLVDPSVGVSEIHHNLAAGNGTGGTGDGFEGIQLFVAIGVKVRNNTVRGNGSDGILVSHGKGVVVTQNRSQSNGRAGIGLDASDESCLVSLNATALNANEGLRLLDVLDSTITRNNSSRNDVSQGGFFDCFINDPDGNTFIANNCGTEDPPGVFD